LFKAVSRSPRKFCKVCLEICSFSCSLFLLYHPRTFEKDSPNFPFVCTIHNWVFHSKWHFLFLNSFLILVSLFVLGSGKYTTNFVSIARLIQNNPTFSCAISLSLFWHFGILQINFESNIKSFVHLSIYPLETQKLCNLFRQFLNSFSLLLYVSRWLRYVQVNQL